MSSNINTRVRSRSPFTPRDIYKTVDGHIANNEYWYLVEFQRASGKRIVKYVYDFNSHPLRDLIAFYLHEDWVDVEEMTGGTFNQRCRALKILEEFLTETGQVDLNPEIYKCFLHWMLKAKKTDGGRRFAESSLGVPAHMIKTFYRTGVDKGYRNWSQSNLDIITITANKVLRGCHQRGMQESADKALSTDTFTNLMKAITFEIEQCKKILAARDAGTRLSLYNLDCHYMAMMDPNPFAAFAILAGARHGIRAEEFNALTSEDISLDTIQGKHILYLHAPNKPDSFLPVDDVFLDALGLCIEWCKEAREIAGPDVSKRLKDIFLVYPTTSTYSPTPLIQLTTYNLNNRILPYFFKKWFCFKVVDGAGNERPLLHAEGDPTRPFWSNFRKLRNAFAVMFDEGQKNREMTTRVMRHRNHRTATRHYLHRTRLEHSKKVHLALKPEAQLLALNLKNARAAGISDATLLKAREVSLVNPSDINVMALKCDKCISSDDSHSCPHLSLLTSSEVCFLADRDMFLTKAKVLEAEGDLRGAENARRRASICEAQLIEIKNKDYAYGGENE